MSYAFPHSLAACLVCSAVVLAVLRRKDGSCRGLFLSAGRSGRGNLGRLLGSPGDEQEHGLKIGATLRTSGKIVEKIVRQLTRAEIYIDILVLSAA